MVLTIVGHMSQQVGANGRILAYVSTSWLGLPQLVYRYILKYIANHMHKFMKSEMTVRALGQIE